MRLSIGKVRRLARGRKLSLTRVLERSGVSRTAFYSLARRDSVFPKTIRSVARTLGVDPLEILEASAETAEAAARARLERAGEIVAAAPGADFHNVWHTLTLLEMAPVERLDRSLRRGRSKPVHG